VSALTKPSVFDKWASESAGVRAVDQGDNVITMFEAIGEDYWSGGGVTAKKIAAQLRAIGPRSVEVQINSPGGDMFEGIAIYNVLREHSQPITIKIMGMSMNASVANSKASFSSTIPAQLSPHRCRTWRTYRNRLGPHRIGLSVG
jgi:ATP-dependent protease ClpP protease subunit